MSSHSYRFKQDVESVFALLTDPEFLVERCVAMGERHVECEVESEGRKTIVRLRRTVKRELPKLLAKMFNAENTIDMTEEWEEIGATKLGKYTAKVEGQPVTLTAKFKLKPAGDGCEYTIEYGCKAGIPVVGGKVEEFVISQTAGGLKAEMDFVAGKLE